MKSPETMRRRIIGFLTIASLAVVAFVDYFTGYEFTLSAAYILPAFLCAWNFGRREIWAVSIASGLASWGVDVMNGHTYSRFMIQYFNSVTCFAASLIAGMLIYHLRQILRQRDEANLALQKALDDLSRSTDEIRKLQNGLQVVCAWTKRIKVGEEWLTPDEFLRTQLHLKLSHGISPEAFNVMKEEINGKKP